jgi:hypothetical protein
METTDYTKCELTLKLKPAFLMFYAMTPLHILLLIVCEQQLFKVFKFQNTHSKTFKKFLPVIFHTSKQCEMLLPLLLLKTQYEFSNFLILAFLLLREDKGHMQLSHAPHDYPC